MLVACFSHIVSIFSQLGNFRLQVLYLLLEHRIHIVSFWWCGVLCEWRAAWKRLSRGIGLRSRRLIWLPCRKQTDESDKFIRREFAWIVFAKKLTDIGRKIWSSLNDMYSSLGWLNDEIQATSSRRESAFYWAEIMARHSWDILIGP